MEKLTKETNGKFLGKIKAHGQVRVVTGEHLVDCSADGLATSSESLAIFSSLLGETHASWTVTVAGAQ